MILETIRLEHLLSKKKIMTLTLSIIYNFLFLLTVIIKLKVLGDSTCYLHCHLVKGNDGLTMTHYSHLVTQYKYYMQSTCI